MWALALGALALLLIGLLALGGWLLRASPEGRALAEGLAPARPKPPAVRRAAAQVERAGAAETPTRLRVEVVDRAGRPVAGLALQLRRCVGPAKPDRPWQTVHTDARGEAEAEVVACAELRSGDAAWRLLGPDEVALGPPELRARVEVARLCPGVVEVSRGGAPVAGRAWLEPGGGGRLDEEGRVDVPERMCGPVLAWVTEAGDPARHRVLPELEVREGQPLRVVLDGVPASPGLRSWTLSVHFDGGDPPDQVRMGSTPCEGEGADWVCACRHWRDCEVSAWWQEALFDWRFVKEEVARVPLDQSSVSIDLDRPPADLLATWTGPQPCAAAATDRETGAVVRGECLPDGTVWIEGLRAGPWEVALSWAGPDAGLSSGSPLRAVRQVEMDGEEKDLGPIGPDAAHGP